MGRVAFCFLLRAEDPLGSGACLRVFFLGDPTHTSQATGTRALPAASGFTPPMNRPPGARVAAGLLLGCEALEVAMALAVRRLDAPRPGPYTPPLSRSQ